MDKSHLKSSITHINFIKTNFNLTDMSIHDYNSENDLFILVISLLLLVRDFKIGTVDLHISV